MQAIMIATPIFLLCLFLYPPLLKSKPIRIFPGAIMCTPLYLIPVMKGNNTSNKNYRMIYRTYDIMQKLFTRAAFDYHLLNSHDKG